LIFKDRRILEFAATIKATFEPVVQTSLYPRSQIDIFVQVIQQDGGLLQAAINGTTLALMNAGIPMLDFVCAISGGVHSKFPLLDLNTLEENDMPNVTIAIMPKTRKVSLVTMETRLHVDRFEELFRVAVDAGKVIQEEMKATILGQSSGLIRSMQIGNQNQNKDFGDVVNE
jgi:exosome complex component RRP41